jgi:hypothetical protein
MQFALDGVKRIAYTLFVTETTTIKERAAMIHKFEKAGHGVAPYSYEGCTEQVITYPDGTQQPAGTCDYCGNGIRYKYFVKSADGVRFGVGSDCIRSIEGASNVASTIEQRERSRRNAAARERARVKRQAAYAAAVETRQAEAARLEAERKALYGEGGTYEQPAGPLAPRQIAYAWQAATSLDGNVAVVLSGRKYAHGTEVAVEFACNGKYGHVAKLADGGWLSTEHIAVKLTPEIVALAKQVQAYGLTERDARPRHAVCVNNNWSLETAEIAAAAI